MIKSLTGLRFYAAVLVFISHLYLFGYFMGIESGSTYNFMDQMGWLGVSLFFVLSGFVLYINYPATTDTLDVKRFYLARFARIYPVFLITALIALPLELLSSKASGVPLPLSFLSQVSLTHCLFEATCGRFNSPGWSISVEAFFYLAFPLLWLLFRNRRILRPLLLLGVVFLIMIGATSLFKDNFYVLSTFPPTRIAEFLTGMVMGHLYLNSQSFVEKLSPVSQSAWFKPVISALLLTLFGLMLLQPVLLTPHPELHRLFNYYYLFPAAGIIFSLALLERCNVTWGFLNHPLAQKAGEISYSFYLLHHLIMRIALHGFRVAGNVLHLPANWVNAFGPAVVFLLFAISLASAYVMYSYLEVPMRRWILGMAGARRNPAKRDLAKSLQATPS